MNGIVLILVAGIFFLAMYKVYGSFIAKRLGINDKEETPSHTMYDGVDYVPAKAPILLGHHFASIAGVGPIVGPVIAAGFGWMPVFVWVLFGAPFIGGVHDYTTIIASIRHKAKSIGQIIEEYIGISGKKIFLIFAWSTLVLVVAVFSIIVADTFVSIPSAGTSSILFILLAILFGLAINKLKTPLWLATIIGVTLLFLSIYAGIIFPLALTKSEWLVILFVYVFIASVTPVWILLQPRDYLNSYFLYALLIGGIIGLFFMAPTLQLPAFTTFNLDKIGFLFPALFVTVACGAVSGFHSIVASGTTSKQLNKESDGKLIGYGGMLIEGILAILALTAVSTFTSKEFSDLLITKGPVTAFSMGVANFIESIPLLSVTAHTATIFVALAVAAFALTTLDTTTRLGRYVFQEFFEMRGETEPNKIGTNRFVATAVTVAAGVALTFSGQTMSIWPVFGSANQLLAGLALLTITVWLVKLKKSFIFTLIPMLFMFSFTLTALIMLFYNNIFVHQHYALAILSVILFILAVVLAVKSYPILANAGKADNVTEKLVTH
ncbi:carbon starvation protein A [bacterium BMS3Abin03]|nr:carbon starvation protein A [bacterium BMS3Abin03]